MNTRNILFFFVFCLSSCTERFTGLSNIDKDNIVNVGQYVQKTDLEESKFIEGEIDSLVFDLRHNVNLINELGFYDFSILKKIDFKVVNIVQQSNGDRNFLLENIKKLSQVEQNEALFIFDLAMKVMHEDFVGEIKNEYLSSRRRIGWRCAQAIAMSTAVTVGAIGITAGTGGAGLGLALFVIGKAYSIQDIVENCR